MVTQHCEDTKSYWIAYFKMVSFISMKNFLFKKRESPGSTYLAWMFTLAEMCVSLFPAQHRVQTPHKIPKSWGEGSSLAPTLGTSLHRWRYQEVTHWCAGLTGLLAPSSIASYFFLFLGTDPLLPRASDDSQESQPWFTQESLPSTVGQDISHV